MKKFRSMKKLRTKFFDWLWGWDSKPKWLVDFVSDHMGFLEKFLCLLAGHEPVADNCDKPDHDYCLFCNKIMPGQAHKE